MTLTDLLAEYHVTADDLSASLESRLLGRVQPGAADLTLGEEAFWAQHAGLPLDREVQPALERTSEEAAALLSAASRSLTIEQAADRLDLHRSRISHRLREGRLYCLQSRCAATAADVAVHRRRGGGDWTRPGPGRAALRPAPCRGGRVLHHAESGPERPSAGGMAHRRGRPATCRGRGGRSRPVVKLPRIPPGPLIRRPGDVHTHRGTLALWRVHQTAGPHVTPWDELRYFGPTTSRFDPQRPPPALPQGA